jgi:hypothetical protein
MDGWMDRQDRWTRRKQGREDDDGHDGWEEEDESVK